MTPDDKFDFTDLERLGHFPRRERGVEQAWVRLRAATVDAERATFEGDQREERERASSRKKIFNIPRPGNPSGFWLSIGAFAVVLALGISVQRIWSPAPASSATEGTREYVTQRGQRATLQLPDGSRMVLAPDTRATYSASAAEGRVIELQGQGYFSVVPDPAHPFIVRTRTVTTRVLGTAFAVRAYATDRTAHVAVAEGKVAIGITDKPTTILLPGDVGYVTPGAQPVVARDAKIADAFGWMRGQLQFEGTPLRDIIIELERAYGIEIRLTDSTLANQRVTGTFTGESVEDVLSLISIGIDATYTKRGSIVVLSAR